MNSSCVIRGVLNLITSVLIRDTQRRDTGKREGLVETEVQMGVTRPQAKERPGPPEGGRARVDSPLELSEGVWPGRHRAFGLLASRDRREHSSVVFSGRVCDLLQQPQDTNTETLNCTSHSLWPPLRIDRS